VSKLTVDEVEDEIREDQNADYAEGKSLHAFNELCAILDFMPAGWENEDGDDAARKSKAEADLDGEDLPELDEKEEEALKGDQSLTWDEEEKDKEDDPAAVNLPDGEDDDEDEEEEGDDDDEEDEENEDGGKSAKAAKPRPRRR